KGRKLVGVNFTEADLEGCDFSDAVFEGCHLVGAYISERTRFDRADLRGAFVSGAHLVKASLVGAVMLPSQVNTMVFDGFGIVVFMDGEGE
ncbi:MAG: pentapeptide repeat-containing protein, partial [Dehalococcoidia bacterium]|nr:pentapeptide repeat-containing protein [Dehalococcoidia bacterium]